MTLLITNGRLYQLLFSLYGVEFCTAVCGAEGRLVCPMTPTVFNFKINFTRKSDGVHDTHKQLIDSAPAHVLQVFVQDVLVWLMNS